MTDNIVNLENVSLVDLLNKFDEKYFSRVLNGQTCVSWSEKMTLCTGKTYMNQYNGRRRCLIKLSKPILKQKSCSDVINTLLHEMIHSYLFLKNGKEAGNGHGEDFRNLMKYINEKEGTRIKVYHNFHKEVDKFRVNIYQCNGPCRYKKPYYGVIKRAISRPPGPVDHWWKKHEEECGGVFEKVNTDLVKELTTLKSLSCKLNKTKYAETVNCKKVEGNVDINYSSKVRNINIQKYIMKYFEFKNKEAVQLKKKSNCHSRSKFNSHLQIIIEKYIKRMKNSLY